jgi:pimeloyl-ACP methyl ester carboxylesterase
MVMFAGGAGDIGIKRNGEIEHANNFVVRTRQLWTDKGYGVVLVDAIGHRSLRGQRSTQAYADVTTQIVTFAHAQANAPVWILGTSQGAIAAMNAASHSERVQVAGVILTESVSVKGGSHETVFDAHPELVRVPALIVANKDDRCKVAPPGMADRIARSLSNTRATVLPVQGGTSRSADSCGSLSPHGYYGMEDQVVDGIVTWMRGLATAPAVPA